MRRGTKREEGVRKKEGKEGGGMRETRKEERVRKGEKMEKGGRRDEIRRGRR